MASTKTVADLFADRLMSAEDKHKASNGILRRMDRLTHKKSHGPVTSAEKTRIVRLIQARVHGALAAQGADSSTYSAVFAYMLQHIGVDEPGDA